MNPETRTTGSNRSVAGRVHRFQAAHSVSVAYSERDMRSNSAHPPTPGIRFHIVRGSLPRIGHNDWQSGTAQSPTPEKPVKVSWQTSRLIRLWLHKRSRLARWRLWTALQPARIGATPHCNHSVLMSTVLP